MDEAVNNGNFIPTASSEDCRVLITTKGKYLKLSFWGNTRGKEDALALLKDMTSWIDIRIRNRDCQLMD